MIDFELSQSQILSPFKDENSSKSHKQLNIDGNYDNSEFTDLNVIDSAFKPKNQSSRIIEDYTNGQMLIQDQGGHEDSYFYQGNIGILSAEKLCSTTSKNTNLASDQKSIRDFEEILKTDRKFIVQNTPKLSDISDLTGKLFSGMQSP